MTEQAAAPLPTEHGGYVIVVRNPGAPGLQGVIFGAEPRQGSEPPPWQRRIRDAIMKLAADVNSADLSEERKVFFIRGLRDVMSDSCVRLAATTQEPPIAGDFLKYIEHVRKDFEVEIEHNKYIVSQQSFAASQTHLLFFVPILAVLGIVGAIFVLAFPERFKEIGNYILAATAAIGGMIVFDWIPRPARDFEEAARREREVRHPLGRVLFTVLITIAICLGVSSGAIEIKIGTWETVKLGEQTKLALFIGFLSGIPTSFLVRKFIAWVFDQKQ